MFLVTLPHRGVDDFGSGEYEAPRSYGKHQGIDYACYPGTLIHSPLMGKVTKFGFPYHGDLKTRYIEITDHNLARHRLFYVKPDSILEIGDLVSPDDLIGEAQDISGKYSGMKNGEYRYMRNHVHYEVLVRNKPVHPELYEL